MEGKENRKCRFTECLSYYDGKEVHQFMGKHEGNLAEKILGNDTDQKWSDLWYVYKPFGYEKTLAEMSDEERKNRIPYESVELPEGWYLPPLSSPISTSSTDGPRAKGGRH